MAIYCHMARLKATMRSSPPAFFGCIPYIKLHLTNNPTFITNDLSILYSYGLSLIAKVEYMRFLIKPIINNILAALITYTNV